MARTSTSAAARAEDARRIRLGTAIAFRAAVVVLLVGLAAWWIYLVRDVLVTALLALVIAAAIHAPVEALERRGVRRVLAVVLVYLGLILLVAVFLALLVPPLIAQAREFADDLPAILGQLSGSINAFLAQLGLSTGGSLVDTILGSLGSLGGILARIPGIFVGFLSALLLVTFLSALMILERDRARAWSMRFIAPADRPALDGLLRKAADRLGAYVRGQLLIMGVTGVGSYVGLTVIGVPFALPLAIFAFLTEAVPIAGPIISGVAMIIVAFTQSPAQGLFAVALVAIIQQAESLVLVPVIQGRLISISPVAALLAVLAGSAIGDIPGAILAIPVTAIIMVVIDDVILPWRRLQIGDDPEPVLPPPPAKPESEASTA
ncbi:MAG TPA: AI-2E family transporter [Candidatus Limnocylindrales bacterium]|nr:AI-2E family transporter [Candidatus Limnocylindrales bacterium]